MRSRPRRILQRILSTVERERTDILSVRSGDPLAQRFAEFGTDSAVVHPYRDLGNVASVAIGDRTLVRAGLLLEALAPPGTVIIRFGDGCHIGVDVRVVAVNGVTLEDGVAIADNVFLADTIHDYRSAEPDAPPWSAGLRLGDPMRIRRGAWIGANSVVTGGIEIGERAIVAPCSVVTRDVPADSLVVGNPAYVQRRRREDGSWEWLVDDDRRPRSGTDR